MRPLIHGRERGVVDFRRPGVAERRVRPALVVEAEEAVGSWGAVPRTREGTATYANDGSELPWVWIAGRLGGM